MSCISVIRLTCRLFRFDAWTCLLRRISSLVVFNSAASKQGWSVGVHTSPAPHTQQIRMAAACLDSPTWTFGLNPKHPGPRVPGPGTYDVAGRLDGGSVGTHFSRIGAKPTCPRADVKRLVFSTGRLQASGAHRVAGLRCSSARNGLHKSRVVKIRVFSFWVGARLHVRATVFVRYTGCCSADDCDDETPKFGHQAILNAKYARSLRNKAPN